MKKSHIHIEVTLDDKNVPEDIAWKATDHPSGSDFQPAKAMIVSLFDKEHRDTLKFDLWTKDMQVQEMDRFIYYSLKSLADTYFKATGNKELSEQMQQFAAFFGQSTEIVKKQ